MRSPGTPRSGTRREPAEPAEQADAGGAAAGAGAGAIAAARPCRSGPGDGGATGAGCAAPALRRPTSRHAASTAPRLAATSLEPGSPVTASPATAIAAPATKTSGWSEAARSGAAGACVRAPLPARARDRPEPRSARVPRAGAGSSAHGATLELPGSAAPVPTDIASDPPAPPGKPWPRPPPSTVLPATVAPASSAAPVPACGTAEEAGGGGGGAGIAVTTGGGAGVAVTAGGGAGGSPCPGAGTPAVSATTSAGAAAGSGSADAAWAATLDASGAAAAAGAVPVTSEAPGSRVSGSTYASARAASRTPRCTYGCACSGCPDGPTAPTGSPSAISWPRATPIDPRWTSVTA